MRILFQTNIPSPYRVDFFNELGKYVDLTVLYERKSANDRECDWINYNEENYKAVYMKGKNYGQDYAFCTEVTKHIKNGKFDHIIIGNYGTLTAMHAILYMNRHHIPFILSTDGGMPKSGKGFIEKLKKYFISSAEHWLIPSKVSDEYFIFYGAKKEKITRYPFTSTKQEDILIRPIFNKEKQELKKKLGMVSGKVLITVGRFIPIKGFDSLLGAARLLSNDIHLYIIGGKPPCEYLDLVSEYKLDNVVFVDFMDKKSLWEYYAASDLFVMSTRGDVWGLVINEAMACGLPIVSTDKCVAGLELVENGVNGYIVPVDDEAAIAEKCNEILLDDSKALKMSQASLDKIKEYTIENMAKEHINLLKKIAEREAN